jgi:hypothetical protein
MTKSALPDPTITLDKAHACRFLLAHQRLLPPRRLVGKEGILDFIRHVGSIQFDPIDIVGRNPDLVLQSRVANYRRELLEGLLYTDRLLLDGWDKMSAIVLREDWPCFARHRALMVKQHGKPEKPAMKIAPYVLDEIRRLGPLSSRDIEHADKVDWWWGRETRLVRASLETLSAMGVVLTHHRVRSVRYFDLAERLLPPEIKGAADPHPDAEAYEDWHVTRRIGGLGLAPASGAPEYWWAIVGVKGTEARAKVLSRLVERGKVLPVAVEGVPKRTFFLRTADLPTLEAAADPPSEPGEVSFLAPLDNVTWDRDLLRQVFDFDYCWEVYKPAELRQFGYYVLPVLCGDRFVARIEPVFDKKACVLTIAGWWWENGIRPDAGMRAALAKGLRDFARYLGATEVRLGPKLVGERGLRATLDLDASSSSRGRRSERQGGR